MFLLSEDVIYHISSVSLWCLAELSVAFVVFSLPAIPKAFAGNTWIKRVLIHLSLWSKSATARTRMNDSSTYSRKTGDTAIKLQSMPKSQGILSESREELRPSSQLESGILRTTRIDVRAGSVEEHQGDENFNQQHTWVENRDGPSPKVTGGY